MGCNTLSSLQEHRLCMHQIHKYRDIAAIDVSEIVIDKAIVTVIVTA